jgi:hypothetical protein
MKNASLQIPLQEKHAEGGEDKEKSLKCRGLAGSEG